jgi:putative hydrolase of the HAD superfamily
MQYEGMPYSWVEFYQQGFDSIIQKYNCNVSKEDIQKSVQILKDFNPRVSGREVEYSAEHIFSNALEHWHIDPPIKNCIETFWHGLKLSAKIYPDTIATLTDLPNAMPDEIFKKDISELLSYFDYYVSSCVAGYRKPNCKGLQMISDKYGVPVTELVFVGDEEKDRKTACNANCKFVHIQRTTKSEGNVSSLKELLQLV